MCVWWIWFGKTNTPHQLSSSFCQMGVRGGDDLAVLLQMMHTEFQLDPKSVGSRTKIPWSFSMECTFPPEREVGWSQSKQPRA